MKREVFGSAAPGFEAARDAFVENIESGMDVGATFVVVRDGKTVVDLWGGHSDAARKTILPKDALFNIWSTTKGLAATCIAMLVDRGLLDYDAPVIRYWPEFGQKGKERVTVAHLFSHQAGLCGVDQPVRMEDFFNHAKIASMLAAQEPFWPLGTGWGYHSIVFGHLADELVRRTDGRTISRFFADEVARPLKADAFMGLPESEDLRQVPMIAPEVELPAPAGEFNERAVAANANPPLDAEWSNRRDWRAAGTAAAGGSAGARGLARIYGALARGGEIDGVRLLSPRALREATAERVRGTSMTSGLPGAYAAGFSLNLLGRLGPNPDSFGHGGFGGSLAFADPKAKLAFAYAMNRMLVPAPGELDPRVLRLVTATFASL